MSAIVTSFASTATSALACRDGLSALADLYRDLGTASSREISQTMAVLESIPSPPTPGPHCGPVGSAMMKIAEKTKAVRQSLSAHVLELEFLGCEAETLALGVSPLADAFPLPASLPGRTAPGYSDRPYEERPVPCERCSRPLDDVFRNCQHCEAHASTPGAPTPLTVIDDVEADIATVVGDIRNGRVTVGQFETADGRRAKRAAEAKAANEEALARLEEAEYDQFPAAVYGRKATTCVADVGQGDHLGYDCGIAVCPAHPEQEVPAQECMGPMCEVCNDVGDSVRPRGDGLYKCEPCQIAHDVLAEEIGADGIKQAIEDVHGALAEEAQVAANGPTPEPAPAKKAPRKRRK